jgi:hypothetical protein
MITIKVIKKKMFLGVTSEVIISSNPTALQDLPQPIDQACSSAPTLAPLVSL